MDQSVQNMIKSVIPELDEFMVDNAEKIVIQIMQGRDSEIEKGHSQAAKAIEVAEASGSLKVFNNWLRYQWAREKESGVRFWSLESQQNKVLAQLIMSALEQVAEKMKDVYPGLSEKEYKTQAVYLSTRFLGYFRRALIAGKYLQREV